MLFDIKKQNAGLDMAGPTAAAGQVAGSAQLLARGASGYVEGQRALSPDRNQIQSAPVQLAKAVGQESVQAEDAGVKGDASAPFYVYLSGTKEERESRQAWGRKLGIPQENMIPLSDKEKFQVRLATYAYNGRVIIATHAGTASRQGAAKAVTNQANLTASQMFAMLKGSLFSREDKPTQVDFLACNTGSASKKSGTSYVERFGDAAKEEGFSGMEMRGPKGFVTRGLGGMLSIVDKYHDDSAKNLGGTVVNASDRDKSKVMENVDSWMDDPEVFTKVAI
jgi:hypothetical protein